MSNKSHMVDNIHVYAKRREALPRLLSHPSFKMLGTIGPLFPSCES